MDGDAPRGRGEHDSETERLRAELESSRQRESQLQRQVAELEGENARLSDRIEVMRSESRDSFGVMMDLMTKLRDESRTQERRIHDLESLNERHKLTELLTETLNGESSWSLAREAVEKDPKRKFVYIDFDGFKSLNDTAGHKQGNNALKDFARAFVIAAGELGHTERTCFHLHGDEFVGVFPSEDAEKIADRIRHHLPSPWEYNGVSLGFSVGVGDTLEAAEQAMYASKRDNGRGR